MVQELSPSFTAAEQLLVSFERTDTFELWSYIWALSLKHLQAEIRDELQYLTNDAQSLLGPGDGYIDLIEIAHKAQMFGQPSSVWFTLNLFTRQRAHCRYDDVTPFTSWKTKCCMLHDEPSLHNRVDVFSLVSSDLHWNARLSHCHLHGQRKVAISWTNLNWSTKVDK